MADNNNGGAAAAAAAAGGGGGGRRRGGGDKKKKEGPAPVELGESASEFDLAEYLGRYSGRTQQLRALFIADRCPELRAAALEQAVAAVKSSSNTGLFRRLVAEYGVPADDEWEDQTDKRAAHQQERLETELATFKTNINREKIREYNTLLGEFHMERGDLATSLKNFVRNRDYNQGSGDVVNMCLAIIKAALEMGNFAHVLTYVSKAEQTPGAASDPLISAQLSACSGLSQLAARKYKLSARRFLDCSPALATAHASFDSVIAPADIGLYGTLCAMATYDRAELRTRVIDNKEFGPYLALQPTLKQALLDFQASKYADCLAALDKLKPVFLIDFRLHEHVNVLYQRIRSRALVQYFSPYSTVDLTRMAAAFGTDDIAGLERELAKLIMEDQIQARIDSHEKRLIASQTDQRVETFERAIRIGEQYAENVEDLIFRANLMRNDFVYKAPKGHPGAGGEGAGQGQGGGGGGGRRGKREKHER